jgi:DUF4097 and DUF4098 domain-containing protein YvlB
VLAEAPAAQAATDRLSRTFQIPPDRAIILEITIGAVHIEGWSKPDVQLEIVRHAPTTDDLSRIAIDIREQPDLHIKALQAGGSTNAAFRADVTLHVPHSAQLRSVRILEGRLSLTALRGAITAEVTRGPIDASQLEGVVRLETSIGDIAADRARLSKNGLLRLRTFNGDIQLSLAERPIDARIMALALNGTIRSDIALQMKDTWGPRWGEATLGIGEPVISLDVITGRIDIKAPPP